MKVHLSLGTAKSVSGESSRQRTESTKFPQRMTSIFPFFRNDFFFRIRQKCNTTTKGVNLNFSEFGMSSSLFFECVPKYRRMTYDVIPPSHHLLHSIGKRQADIMEDSAASGSGHNLMSREPEPLCFH